jgi:EAL domain-containing protein (putative c-di-GMP-specific phosphodiesterase class I)
VNPQGTFLDQVVLPGQLKTLYQPILSFASGPPRLLGLECLTRGPSGTNFEIADVLFEYARRKRREELVDAACMRAALQNAGKACDMAKLFINVHASTLGRNQFFVDSLEEACIQQPFPLSSLVIEVVEHTPCWNRGEFARSVTRLRDLGVQLAVDDMGVAYSSFAMILDTAPEFLKIDMYITRTCTEDPLRRAMIKSFQHLAEGCQSELIAEGIETKEEMQVVMDLGVYNLQGYLFSMPKQSAEISHFICEDPRLGPLTSVVPERSAATFAGQL